jgi:fructuronate reductase
MDTENVKDTSLSARHLSRSAGDGRPAAPVRLVHVGLGNFSRAHLAWYTEHAPDADEWGIAAFTGRSTALADAMAPQDGLYTLVTRAPDGDRYEVVSSISRVHAASDHAAWLGYLSSPELAVVTLTVTEAGYLRGADGGIDADDVRVREDVAALRRDPTAPVGTAPGRLVAGFLARRAAGAGPIAVVALDNLPDNGAVVARVATGLAALVDPTLSGWIAQHICWVTTMVDRITPAATADDRAGVLTATGVTDPAAVVTEPFAEWVLSGSFPAGRPAWERAGARFVEHIDPSEERKLWLLNGAHSLLAYGASIRGHETVADAVADPVCRGWVEQWWDEASRHLRVPADEVSAYRAALLERFENQRMRDLLARIAADGSQKLPVRIVPVLRRERATGRPGTGAARAVAAWVLHLRGAGAPVKDPRTDELSTLVRGTLDDAVQRVLSFLGVVADLELREHVVALATELEADR